MDSIHSLASSRLGRWLGRSYEVYGIQPVPYADRTASLSDLMAIFFNICLNPGAIMRAGLSVVAGLTLFQACAMQVAGTLCAAAFCVMLSRIGCEYGIPGQVATRSAFGIHGAKYIPSLTRVVASIYNFAFQTTVGCLAIREFLVMSLDVHVSLQMLALVFGIIQVIVAVVGFDMLKSLSRVATPIKAGIICILMVTLLHGHGLPDLQQHLAAGEQQQHGWLLLAVWFDVYASIWLTLIPDAADFTRHLRSDRRIWVAIPGAIFAGSLLASSFGALGAVISNGHDANVLTVIMHDDFTVVNVLLVMVLVIFDNWTINALNIYTGGLSLCNAVPLCNRLNATLIVSILGITWSMSSGLMSGVVWIHAWIGSIFAPMAGVLVADYLLVRRGRIDVESLYRASGPYWYTRGVNLYAVLWVGIGIVIFRNLPEASLRPILCLVLVALGYGATWRVFPAYWKGGENR